MASNRSVMNDERDTDSGEFTEKYDSETFLEAIREHDGAASTAEVAERVGAPRRTAYGRLERLHDDGQLEKRSVGAGVLWMVAEGS